MPRILIFFLSTEKLLPFEQSRFAFLGLDVQHGTDLPDGHWSHLQSVGK